MASGEYYALLLLATAGMMLMGAATDLYQRRRLCHGRRRGPRPEPSLP